MNDLFNTLISVVVGFSLSHLGNVINNNITKRKLKKCISYELEDIYKYLNSESEQMKKITISNLKDDSVNQGIFHNSLDIKIEFPFITENFTELPMFFSRNHYSILKRLKSDLDELNNLSVRLKDGSLKNHSINNTKNFLTRKYETFLRSQLLAKEGMRLEVEENIVSIIQDKAKKETNSFLEKNLS